MRNKYTIPGQFRVSNQCKPGKSSLTKTIVNIYPITDTLE